MWWKLRIIAEGKLASNYSTGVFYKEVTQLFMLFMFNGLSSPPTTKVNLCHDQILKQNLDQCFHYNKITWKPEISVMIKF